MARIKGDLGRARWPDHRTPGKRLEGLADIACTPTFEIRREDRIFTVGSCFARNIEFRLEEIGFDTPMYSQIIRARLGELGESLPFFNKYNVAVIRKELEWAAGQPRPPEDHLLLRLPSGMVQDAFFNPRSKTGAPLEEARARRAYVEGLFRSFPQCRVLVVTLGLVEVWRDVRSNLLLNVTPSRALIEAEPDRFVLDVLSYDEILADLEGIHALLSGHGHPDFRILITVSPVPLIVTFRPIDVISANSYSKSVQRAAVEVFVQTHDNVDYFPSYETVTMTDRRLAFDADNRHVQAGVVARVVDRFLRAYSPGLQFEDTTRPLIESSDDPHSAQEHLAAAKMQMKARHYDVAADHLRQLIARYGDKHKFITAAELRLRYGTCLTKAGMLDMALEQLRIAAASGDATPYVLLKLADRLMDCGDTNGANEALCKAEEQHGPELDLKVRRARILAAQARTDEAHALLNEALAAKELDPKLRKLIEVIAEQLRTREPEIVSD